MLTSSAILARWMGSLMARLNVASEAFADGTILHEARYDVNAATSLQVSVSTDSVTQCTIGDAFSVGSLEPSQKPVRALSGPELRM